MRLSSILTAVSVSLFGWACAKSDPNQSSTVANGGSPRAQPTRQSQRVSTATDQPPAAAQQASNLCQQWRVADEEGTAQMPLEVFCERFGPCPRTLEEAGSREPAGSPPMVSKTARGLWLTYGTLNGWEYAFDRQGTLIRASVWRESPFGDCKQMTRYRGGAGSDVGDDEAVERCGFVPGRDLLRRPVCVCQRPKARPTRVGLDRGPLLAVDMECLYEFGLVGDFCPRKLESDASKPGPQRGAIGGCVSVSNSALDTDCVYDAAGELLDMRIGKRFVSKGFGSMCRQAAGANRR